MGSLPMRDIVRLPNPAKNFAADFAPPSLAPGHDAERSRDDLHAHRAAHLADLGSARIAAITRLADAVDAANDGLAGRRIAQFERKHFLGRLAADFDACQKTLSHQHAANRLAQA